FAADERAAGAAREALAFVAGDIPSGSFDDAQLLLSELVTNSVVHGPSAGDTVVAVSVDVGAELLRVEVSDAAVERPELRTPDDSGGYGLIFVDRLASRWGA